MASTGDQGSASDGAVAHYKENAYKENLFKVVDPFEDGESPLDQDGFVGTDPIYQNVDSEVRNTEGDLLAPPAVPDPDFESAVPTVEVEDDEDEVEEEPESQPQRSSSPVTPPAPSTPASSAGSTGTTSNA